MELYSFTTDKHVKKLCSEAESSSDEIETNSLMINWAIYLLVGFGILFLLLTCSFGIKCWFKRNERFWNLPSINFAQPTKGNKTISMV